MRPAVSAFMLRIHMLGGGTGGQYPGHHRFWLMDEYYTWDYGSVLHKH